MTEFLTENARRAYPLAHELPDGIPWILGELLVDAAVACDLELGDTDRLQLVSVLKTANALFVKVGLSDAAGCVLGLVPGDADHQTAYGSDGHFKAFLTVRTRALRAILDDAALAIGTLWEPHVPFALRCTSSATKRVTAILADSPEDPCATPVYGEETAHTVKTATSDVILSAHGGLDLETTAMAPLPGTVLRISAITAPAETAEGDRQTDLLIRGDDCFEVEAIPGVHVTYDEAGNHVLTPIDPTVPGSDPLSEGAVVIRAKCKPCCQCEDYEAAFNVLKPINSKTKALAATLGHLDATRTDASLNTQYRTAMGLFTAIKGLVTGVVNSYRNVHGHATAVTSGGVYDKSTAMGRRARIAVTLVVDNMTLQDVDIAGCALVSGTLPPGYSQVKAHWTKSDGAAGESPDGKTWSLSPGQTLCVVFTLANPTSTSNTAVFTSKSKVSVRFTATLPQQPPRIYTVEVT